jgi:L-iditol 2-dehydrogenase
LTDIEAALLEPLGVAIHTVDLARIRVGDSVVILGAGPIGLLILQIALLAGAAPVFMVDPLPWRLERARAWGGAPVDGSGDDAIAALQRETRGRGVDVAIEAAWADASVSDAVEMARLGGRVVLVGIPGDDRLSLKHSTARRKGLTLRLCRRMKHVYPRAIRLAETRRVDLRGLVSHEFPLEQAAEAFRFNAAYSDRVLKVMIHSATTIG